MLTASYRRVSSSDDESLVATAHLQLLSDFLRRSPWLPQGSRSQESSQNLFSLLLVLQIITTNCQYYYLYIIVTVIIIILASLGTLDTQPVVQALRVPWHSPFLEALS